jgi:hypothetical protein
MTTNVSWRYELDVTVALHRGWRVFVVVLLGSSGFYVPWLPTQLKQDTLISLS